MAHTNGTESSWAALIRAHTGTFRKFCKKYLLRYFFEFSGRHNDRDANTVNQTDGIVVGMVGKQLTHEQLITDNG